jgi:hypothetical protein
MTTDAASTMAQYSPAIGGDAETGVQAIRQDTGFDPAAPADQANALAAQLQQAQSLLVGTATGAATTAGGDAAAASVAAPGSFRAAIDTRAPIQLQPMQDGAAAIANLDRIVQAREERVARIQEAFLTDPNASPADQAKLDQERTLLKETRALRDKLASLAETIDPNEAGAILQLVGSANQRGSYNPEQLAELMIQVEGSALNLPTSYLEAAMRAQELLEQTRADMEAMMQQLASSPNAQLTPETLAPILEMEDNQLKAQEALRANFELAKRDPATAQAQLQQLAA